MRQVILHPGEDGFWIAEVPSLPGCISQGQTREEAIRSIREAIEAWISAAHDLRREVPPETFQTQVCVVEQ